MQGYVYQSEFARKYYSRVLQRVANRGCEAACSRCYAPSWTRSPEDEAAIEAVHDEHRLTELIGVLVRATNAIEVRAALASLHVGGLDVLK